MNPQGVQITEQVPACPVLIRSAEGDTPAIWFSPEAGVFFLYLPAGKVATAPLYDDLLLGIPEVLESLPVLNWEPYMYLGIEGAGALGEIRIYRERFRIARTSSDEVYGCNWDAPEHEAFYLGRKLRGQPYTEEVWAAWGGVVHRFQELHTLASTLLAEGAPPGEWLRHFPLPQTDL